MDFLFLEFYIQKKYNIKVESYFNIGKQSVSDWRKSNIVPIRRLLEFQIKEGSISPLELLKNFYKSI